MSLKRATRFPRPHMASSFLIRLKIRKKRYAIMGTIAIVLNYMQDAPDCIKVQKLNNPYPCNDYW